MAIESVTQPTRLYVGGLPHDVSPDQIAQRFRSFGTVQEVELVPEKEGSVTARPTVKPCRGFAYVHLTPKDDAALHRCISMYNGCKWMGGVLRVEPAMLHYKVRLAQEKLQEELEQAHEPSPEAEGPPQRETVDLPPLTILRRDGKKTMKTAANRVKTYFPPVKQPRPGELSWGPVAPPPGAMLRQQVLTAQARVPLPAPLQTQAAVRNDDVEPQSKQQDVLEKSRNIAREQQMTQAEEAAAEEEAPAREPSSESEELAAVDFMDSDAEGPPVIPAVQDGRFDSSDEDEAALAGPAGQEAGSAANSAPAGRNAAGAVQAAEAQKNRQGTTTPFSAADRFDSSDGEEDGAVLAAGQSEPPAAGVGESYSGEDSEEEGVEGAQAGGDHSENADEAQAGTSSAADGSVSSSDSEESSAEESEKSSEGEIEDPPTGAVVEMADEGQELGDRPFHSWQMVQLNKKAMYLEACVMHDSEGDDADNDEGLGEDAGDSGEQDPAADMDTSVPKDIVGLEQPASDGDTGSDPEGHDLEEAAHRTAIKDATAPHQQRNADLLAGLAGVLPQGAAFCRTVGGAELEAAWRAARDTLVADYKSKRRTALKQLPSNKRGRFHA